MKVNQIHDMTKGWFIGNFEPSLFKTNDVEVALKRYKAGDNEAPHFHKIATEYTVVVEGEIEMNGRRFHAGDIITVEPGEVAQFKAITDATNVVVKIPGASNDKYTVSESMS